MSTVLVTGGSGFIGSHCIAQLLSAGHRVCATVRSPTREETVRAMLREAGVQPNGNLTFAVADLESDVGWKEAVSGCDYVLHVASPLPAVLPKDENELIIPAREGALRVLRAAKAGGVKRVVLTSSFAAIATGHPQRAAPFDETIWADLKGRDVTAYGKSKTIAERAAWDFIEKEGGLELSVINPTGVFGPVLGPDYSSSILIIQRLMDGALPGLPHVYYGIIDVRDVADLHIRAMTNPAAKGERFIAVSGDFMSFLEIAETLKERMGEAGRNVPTRQLPDWLLRIVALFNPEVRQVLPELGKKRNASSAKAQRLLGWHPRPREEALVATAESLLRLGLLKEGAK